MLEKTPKLHLTQEYRWDVTLNDRGRAAYLRQMDVTVENGQLKFLYTIKTSVYGAFKDIDITVGAYRLVTVGITDEKFDLIVGPAVEVFYDADDGSTFDDFDGIKSFGLNQNKAIFGPLTDAIQLPGNVIWKFIDADLKSDGNLYIKTKYEEKTKDEKSRRRQKVKKPRRRR